VREVDFRANPGNRWRTGDDDRYFIENACRNKRTFSLVQANGGRSVSESNGDKKNPLTLWDQRLISQAIRRISGRAAYILLIQRIP
jgi:hypothetical protein